MEVGTKRPITKRPITKRPKTKRQITKRPKTKRPIQQNAQCNKTPNATKRPITKRPKLQNAQMQQKALNPKKTPKFRKTIKFLKGREKKFINFVSQKVCVLFQR